MKKLITALSVLLVLLALPAHAQFTKSTLSSQITQQFPDNNTGAITPSILRSWLQNSLIPSFQQFTGVNPQAGTSYTIQLSDYGQLVTFSNASAIAVTLPQAIAPFTPFNFYAKNVGTGPVTVTPQGGSTINGASTLVLNGGAQAWIVSDGTNYQIFKVAPALPFVSVEDFGASSGASAAVNTAAFQGAVNSLTAGGILIVPGSGYNISGTITVSSPITVLCSNFLNASTATINATGVANTVFALNSNYPTVRDCVINRAGATVGTAISLGQDYKSVTNATVSNGSTSLVSPSAGFTSADVGTHVYVANGTATGPLLTTIAGVTNLTTAVMAAPATCGGGCPGAASATLRWGNWYREATLDNVKLINHAIGVDIGATGQVHINKLYANATRPINIFNHVGQGFGASSVSDSTLLASNSDYGVWFESGSDWRFVNNKFLGGIYNFYMQWDQSPEANLFITDSSLENFQTASIFLTSSFQYDRIVIANNSFGSTVGTAVQIDNTSSAPLTDVTIQGNTLRLSGFAGTGISIGNCSWCLVKGNIVDFGGAGTGIALLSASANTKAIDNQLNVATQTTDAGTANSRVWNVATGGTGLSSGTSGGIPYFSSATTMASSGVLGANNVLVGGGGGGAPGANGFFSFIGNIMSAGINASSTGAIDFANGGGGGASARIQNSAATVAYNFNLPATAGTTGQPLLSGGGGAGAQTYGTLGIGAGGTGQTTLAAFLATLPKPTTQTFLSGSGTYTTPANATWLELHLVGGGGGGAGSGNTPAPGAATAGGNTCWNTSGAACTTPVYQAGGGALGSTNGSSPAGGTVAGSSSCNILSVAGGNGGPGSGTISTAGGNGGASTLGGTGYGAAVAGGAGAAAGTNTGSGGGGGSATATNGGSGGGAGATCWTILGSPAGTYTYAIGAIGAAGSAGGGGQNGGAGSAGQLVVIEHYNYLLRRDLDPAANDNTPMFLAQVA